VSQVVLVARVALRELWMSFRILFILVAFAGGSAVLVLVPSAPAVTLDRMAIGLGVATVAASAIAAWTMAAERAAGRAGWLVTRSVSRGTYLVGWLTGLAVVTIVGVIGSSALGWLTTASLPIGIEGTAFVAAIGAVVTTAIAALALGLAIGSLLPPIPAALVAAAACAASGVLVLVASGGSTAVPGAAYLLISRLAAPESVLTDALRAAGVGLVQIAVLFVIARAAIDRAEL
jgi:hypothetical protein